MTREKIDLLPTCVYTIFSCFDEKYFIIYVFKYK